MIPRYSRPEMVAIWSPETRFRIWFEIEAHAADAMAKLGIVPKAAAKKIWDKGKNAKFDVARIDEIERDTKHDVIAFLTHLGEIVGPEARFVHSGMTSSDVLDTCLNVQLTRAADILIADVDKLLRRAEAPRLRAQEDPDHRPLARHPRRADDVRREARDRLCGIFPRAGSAWSRRARRSRPARSPARSAPSRRSIRASRRMSPRPWGSRSSRCRPRSSRATATRCSLRRLAWSPASIERLATEIRHLQRTEVLEAEEFFSEGQKGSSAMPHKRNPVLSENLTGLARMVRAYVTPAMENVALWHERDISHSSVERMIGPDATVTLDFALNRLAGLIDKLVVYPEQHADEPRPARRPRAFAARADRAHAEAGMSREDAYKARADARHAGLAGQGRFPHAAQGRSQGAAKLKPAEIEKNFDLGYHFKHVDTIFKRVFGKASSCRVG